MVRSPCRVTPSGQAAHPGLSSECHVSLRRNGRDGSNCSPFVANTARSTGSVNCTATTQFVGSARRHTCDQVRRVGRNDATCAHNARPQARVPCRHRRCRARARAGAQPPPPSRWKGCLQHQLRCLCRQWQCCRRAQAPQRSAANPRSTRDAACLRSVAHRKAASREERGQAPACCRLCVSAAAGKPPRSPSP